MMDKKIKKLIIFGAIFFVFFLYTGSALALEVQYPTIFGFSLNSTSTIGDFICYLFGLGLALAGFVAVLAIAFGGIYYIVSYGRGKFTSEAKDWIKAGVFGLLIIVCSSSAAYTINPSLNKCKPWFLPAINLNPSGNPTSFSNVPSVTYETIPIGSLTEKLLSDTMGCYEFDPQGNPIDYATINSSTNPVTDDNGQTYSSPDYFIPTYLDHDRADCILQLTDGAQKKAQKIAELSDAITKLMNECSCQGKCDDTCGGQAGCEDPTTCPGGSCKGDDCVPDGSPTKGACKQGAESCCPDDIKSQIEHGPVQVGCDNLETEDFKIPPGQQPSTNCQPQSLSTIQGDSPNAIINSAINVCIGPGTSRSLAQTAMGDWNAITPHPVFGNISSGSNCNGQFSMVSQDEVDSICGKAANGGQAGGCSINQYSGTSITGFKIILTTQGAGTASYNQWLNWAAIHEFGHALGLSHPYDLSNGQLNLNCTPSIMGYTGIPTKPGAPDIAEVKILYGGGSSTPTPTPTPTPPSNSCNNQCKAFNGLDEFRCDKGQHTSCDDVVSFVEKEITINKKTIKLINQDKWKQLNLIQQLTYFQDKINEIKNKIQLDATELNQAKTALNKCYLSVPYIDLVQSVKNTDNTNKIIFTQNNWKNNDTQQTIDTSKYCSGFNYANSSCLKKCDDECPDASSDATDLYKNCQICTGNDAQCLDQQEQCIEQAYGQRPCPYKPANSSYNTFNDCITSCQTDCSSDCDKKYLSCFGEYAVCTGQCKANSQCVIDNADSCLFGSQGFVDCGSDTTDQGNTQYCINRAYLCKNGSDQYAGYPDCAEPSSSNASCSSYTAQQSCQALSGCMWDGVKCVQNTTASYFYDNVDDQKCPAPYNTPDESSICYNSTKSNTSCQELCPETAKCPAASNCPDCPCDQEKKTLTFSVPNKSNGGINTPGDNAGQEGYTNMPQKISANQIVGAECNGYNYNDDPLTFYCQDQWWTDPNREGQNTIPIGGDRGCPVDQEVPVGQTVDGAENWAAGIISTASNEVSDIGNLISLITMIGKAIGTNDGYNQTNEQDYCKCNAKFQSDKPICTTNCGYSQSQDPNTGAWTCSCTFEACSGSPCQQLVIWLLEVWDDYRTLKTDWMNFYLTMIQDPRSDIMKMLTYSRQATSSCSVAQNNFGTQARLLDCTRAEDEKIPDILSGRAFYNGKEVPGYCYGQALGKLFNTPLTDDWFCCNLQKINNPTEKELENNP